MDELVFRGQISEIIEQSAGYQLWLTDLTPVIDPIQLVVSFTQTVGLNLSQQQWDSFGLVAVSLQAQVKVCCQNPPIMTMSLPPQIPGICIDSVKELSINQ